MVNFNAICDEALNENIGNQKSVCLSRKQNQRHHIKYHSTQSFLNLPCPIPTLADQIVTKFSASKNCLGNGKIAVPHSKDHSVKDIKSNLFNSRSIFSLSLFAT